MELFFYILNVSDERIRDCLDTIRLVCDPTVTDHVHMTVRGPYKESSIRSSNKKWTNFSAETIYIQSVANFFAYGQNTIFLSCDVPGLASVWWKPDYKEGRYHITLYDGPSRKFAKHVYRVLSEFDWQFSVPSGKLELLSHHGPQENLFSRHRIAVLGEENKLDLSWQHILHMDDLTRLQYIQKLCQIITRPKADRYPGKRRLA